VPDTEDILRLQNTGKVSSFRGRAPETGERITAVSAPLAYNGDLMGIMRYETSMRLVDRQVLMLTLAAVGLSLLILVLVYLSNGRFVRSIVDPVQRITTVAQRIAAGSYGIQVEKRYDDEVGELTDAINDMSQKIKQAESMKSDFISSVSHELRTPLTAIRGLLEPLSDGMIKDDAVKMRYYGIMLHEVERLSRLITDMLQLSRLQSGTEYMEKTTFNIGELIDDVYQSYLQNAQQKGIHLELDIEDDLPDVISDPDRIEQVLVILLDNAMRYAGEGGTIRIGAHQDASDVHVSVWDSGCGISPEDMVHVFERFYKTDKSRKEGGTGLGLSIAKQIMDKLDEQITVQSEVGKWTCFTFTVKKYVSNAIALGPVDDAAIVYNDLSGDQPGSKETEEKESLDAPFEVLRQDKKGEKPRFKNRVIKKKETK
jgi:signal transduction histidine kinase